MKPYLEKKKKCCRKVHVQQLVYIRIKKLNLNKYRNFLLKLKRERAYPKVKRFWL